MALLFKSFFLKIKKKLIPTKKYAEIYFLSPNHDCNFSVCPHPPKTNVPAHLVAILAIKKSENKDRVGAK